MKIQLNSTRVVSLNFDLHLEEESKIQNLAIEHNAETSSNSPFNLSYSVGYDEELPKTFAVRFDILVNSTQGFGLKVEFIALFDCDEEVDEAFVDGPFPRINAPAIAYPYIRSFISILILNAGYDPIILPTVNFQQLGKMPEKEPPMSQTKTGERKKGKPRKKKRP